MICPWRIKETLQPLKHSAVLGSSTGLRPVLRCATAFQVTSPALRAPTRALAIKQAEKEQTTMEYTASMTLLDHRQRPIEHHQLEDIQDINWREAEELVKHDKDVYKVVIRDHASGKSYQIEWLDLEWIEITETK